MPSTTNTPTVKVISADKGIKFFNPKTGKVEEITENTELPLNAIPEASGEASLKVMVDGKLVVVPVSSDGKTDIQSGIDAVTRNQAEAEAQDSETAVTYQPLPSLQTSKEPSAADLKPARTGGFEAPVVTRSVSDPIHY